MKMNKGLLVLALLASVGGCSTAGVRNSEKTCAAGLLPSVNALNEPKFNGFFEELKKKGISRNEATSYIEQLRLHLTDAA